MITFRLAAIIVTACDSAEAALEHIGSNGYDLVITDLNMPGMKGLTLVWAIKVKCPDIPILVITGHGDDEAERQARHAGADGFLQKPFDRDHLIAVIERLLLPSTCAREAVLLDSDDQSFAGPSQTYERD